MEKETFIQSDKYFDELVSRFSGLEETEAIALGGSRAKGSNDQSSDYDLYIYLNKEVPASKRQELLDDVCKYMEINNQFWETEDDCTLKNGIDIDIIYRSLPDIRAQIEQVKNGLAYTGYTTCLWDNVVNGKILYDSNGKLSELKESLNSDYPENLRKNIIEKNLKLLHGFLPSYDGQIKKAASRNDLPSIQHRTAAFLESYFDILFALNKMLHPGEKRMMEKLENAPLLPDHFEENLNALFQYEFSDMEKFLNTLESIIKEVNELAEKEGFSTQKNS